jgi:hypothetical protein
MAIEITNTLRSGSIVRAEGTGTFYANVSALSVNADETVTSADIKRINWSTGGTITIARNGATIATLYGTGEIRCDDYGHSIRTNNTSNVAITIATGGTVFLEMSKTASYANSLVGFM